MKIKQDEQKYRKITIKLETEQEASDLREILSLGTYAALEKGYPDKTSDVAHSIVGFIEGECQIDYLSEPPKKGPKK